MMESFMGSGGIAVVIVVMLVPVAWVAWSRHCAEFYPSLLGTFI